MDFLQDIAPPPADSDHQRRASLKMITCVIRPEKLNVVKDALHELNLVGGITLSDVRGFGRQKGSVEHYMGVPYRIRFVDKVRMDLVVSSEDVSEVISVVSRFAHTGHVGDGKIFVVDVLTALRIRTGEKGVDAL